MKGIHNIIHEFLSDRLSKGYSYGYLLVDEELCKAYTKVDGNIITIVKYTNKEEWLNLVRIQDKVKIFPYQPGDYFRVHNGRNKFLINSTTQYADKNFIVKGSLVDERNKAYSEKEFHIKEFSENAIGWA